MSEFRIQSFKYGLDSRRSELTSQPGTLFKLENAHVNQGAEIEKRKAFARYFDATNLDPTKVFGLQPTSQGLVVFGSVSAATVGLTAWPSYATNFAGCPPISYMQLQHPDGSTQMSSVISSDSYSDIPFVSAQFSDNSVYCYYNGTLVSDFTAGLILASMKTAGVVDNTKIAAALAGLVNATDDYTAAQSGAFIDIANTDYNGSSAATALTSASGTITIYSDAQGTTPVAGSAAIGGFSIAAGSDGNGTLTSIKVNGVELLDSTVTFTTDVNTTALLVAKAINKSAAAGARTAFANGNQISIFAQPGTASTNYTSDNGYDVQVTVSGQFVVGDYSADITGTGFIVQLKVGVAASETSIMSKPSWGVPAWSVNIASITHSGTTNTVNTSAAHNLQTGDVVTISGCTNTNNNGTFTITKTSATQFTVTNASGASQASAAGSVSLTTSYSSIALMLAAMVTDINTNSATYNAYTDGSSLFLGLKVTSSADVDTNYHVLWSVTILSGGIFNASAQSTGSLQAIANPLTVTCVPVINSSQATSGYVTCQPAGGTKPYSFSWLFQSGNAFITPVSPTSGSTQFRVATTAPAGNAVYKCVLVDSSTQIQQATTQAVTVIWKGFGL